MFVPIIRRSFPLLFLTAATATSCSGTEQKAGDDDSNTGTGRGMDASPDTDTGADSGAGTDTDSAYDTEYVPDPETCEEAAQSHTYVGCDFWPTVLPNTVGTHFDYAVVVSNAGTATATVTIEHEGKVVASGDVAPSGLKKFFLPWVAALKNWNVPCGETGFPVLPLSASKRVVDGAYHLTSTVPVTVFQFSPLEYGAKGGPEGKDWSACKKCIGGCYSYTNDASLLLPSTALTGNYRITAPPGQNASVVEPGYFAVTGIEDGTTVKIKVGPLGEVKAGGGLSAAQAGQIFSFKLAKAEVVIVTGTPTTDLSGTILNADKPVQAISGAPCHQMPAGVTACDHLEETVVPAETLGRRYFVVVPTSARGQPVGHIVRIYGNVDNTKLTYFGVPPAGAPATINAGEVYDLGQVGTGFEVKGSHELAVTSFLLGSQISDTQSSHSQGDPAQSNVQPVEQYRKKYVFLAPDDYISSYADVVAPTGAAITLDGETVTAAEEKASNGYAVRRIKLGAGQDGAHVIESDQPFGMQVMGYGSWTSYQYPGGLNLLHLRAADRGVEGSPDARVDFLSTSGRRARSCTRTPRGSGPRGT
ncbi:MAG: IgGFc-binding protein [Deltaproteobacteria bacterium]|nr:IgGFc-binding protein [Deltaproteobacteria bacterium]